MAANGTESRSLKARFEAVYRHNQWGDDESASGAGSRRDSECVKATENALDSIIEEFSVLSIVDAPCGDFNWMHRFLERYPDIAYTGLDIVDDLILANRQAFPAKRFSCVDLTETVPPRADLVLCKDLVNHLTNEDVCRVLHNFKASGSTLLLLSNNQGWDNVELPYDIGGSSRHLDVTQSPFEIPQPIWKSHYLALWRMDQIPSEFVLPATQLASSEMTDKAPSDYVVSPASLMDSIPPLQVLCKKNGRGIVLFGPYVRAKSGRYRASFRLHCPAPKPSDLHEPCARVEVTADNGMDVLCEKTVAPVDLLSDPRVILDFELKTERVLELRVHHLGRLDFIADYDRHLVRLEQRFRAPTSQRDETSGRPR